MNLFKYMALGVSGAAGLLFVAGVPIQNSVTVVASLSILQSTPTAAAYSGMVMRVTDGTAGAPPMAFLSGSGTCSSVGYTNDGASCVNSSDGNHWLGYFTGNIYDVRQWSPSCNPPTVDSTTALQAAANFTATRGGVLTVTCGLHIAGTVTLSSTSAKAGLRLTGLSNMYFPGIEADTSATSVWPPAAGPYIDCGNSAGTNCLQVAGQAVEIDHLPLGNTQPTPGSTFTPTPYGFLIGTVAANNWGGLYIHDDSFTAADNCIDLEGNSDYTVDPGNSGAQYRLAHLWMNPCFFEGIKAYHLDNTGNFEDIHYDFWWNRGTPSVGQFVKQNSIGIDACFLSNTIIHGVEFFANKAPMQFTNCSVKYSSSLTKTFAAVNLQMTNIDFNTTCTGFTQPSGNAVVTGSMTNVVAYMDQSGQCSGQTSSPGNVFFNLASDFDDFSMHSVIANGMQTVAAIGAGKSGFLRMWDVQVSGYSALTASQNAFAVSANSRFSLGPTDLALIDPATPAGGGSAGKILGPGLDGTQGYTVGICAGGGPNAKEGGACLQGSQGGTLTGSLILFDPSNVEQGYVSAASGAGVNINAVGKIFLNPGSKTGVQIGTSGGRTIINPGSLPTSCTGQATGTFYVPGVHRIGQC
jgi:hypothetical protein